MDDQFNRRQSTQIEELETMKSQLVAVTTRPRNLSTDRQSQFSLTRNTQKSQSVEKFMNLKQQNNNVDNLFSAWNKQKLNSSNQVIQEIPEYESPQMKQLMILESEEVEDFAAKIQQKGKPKDVKNIKTQPKQPVRPQTTKASISQGNIQAPARKQPTMTQSQVHKQTPIPPLSMKHSQVVEKDKDTNSSISSSAAKSTVNQTPKVKPSAILDKNRNTRQQQKLTVPDKRKETGEERQVIQQVQKMKQNIIQLYEKQFGKGVLQHSQNLICTNLDQIVSVLQLDFKCLD